MKSAEEEESILAERSALTHQRWSAYLVCTIITCMHIQRNKTLTVRAGRHCAYRIVNIDLAAAEIQCAQSEVQSAMHTQRSKSGISICRYLRQPVSRNCGRTPDGCSPSLKWSGFMKFLPL